MRGREEPDPGARALPAGPADDAGNARAAHPRLRAARHHEPVRRDERCRRDRDRRHAPPAPGRRVRLVPREDRRRGARRARRARGVRQLRDPQDAERERMAGTPPALPHALHADLFELAEPGRAPVRGDHPSDAPPQRPGIGEGRARVGQGMEREPRPFKWTKTADQILSSLA